MQPTDILAAEAAIIKQISLFFTSLDERDFDRMASIMAANGVWRRAGVDLVGPEGLLAEMAKRPDNRHSRHMLTNLIPEIAADGSAMLRFYSAAWVHIGGTDDKGIAPMALPNSIGAYTARFVRDSDGWKISDLRAKSAFRKAK